jgi:hypothetical protein
MKVIKFAPGLIPVLKHQDHDQSSHGNWADGSQGSATELSDNEISDIISGSNTVNEMYQKVAERLGKSMKPKLEDLSEEEINFFRGVTDVNIQAQSLLNGEIRFTPFQTWGQGIYISSEPEYASAYGDLIGLKLDKSVKLVEGEIAWTKAYSLFDKETSLDMPKILDRITSGKMDNFSDSDIANIYWAAKGYDGYSIYRYGRAEVVLFNADKLTVNKADIGEAVRKHGSHDQKTHGNWASGNYDDLAQWYADEMKVFSTMKERDAYFEEMLLSQRKEGFTEEKYPEFRRAIGEYESALGYSLNDALRDPQVSESAFKDTIEFLDRAIETAPPLREEVIAYRGVKGNGLNFFEKLTVGDVFEDKGYVSTTIDAGVAQQFGTSGSMYQGLAMRIKLPAGSKGIFPSGYKDQSEENWDRNASEAEFLLPRGSKFKVTAIRGKVWDVELIP